MKRSMFILLFTLISISTLQAQTWDYFFHPRQNKGTLALGSVSEWQFHPTFTISATWIRPGLSGTPANYQFLSAAGPALTLQHTKALEDGSNYADYSVNLVFLLSGESSTEPLFKSAVALAGGFFNNVIELGVGYDITKRTDNLSRIFFLVSVGVNLSNN